VKTRVLARAFANIALVKYWGKLPTKINSPATPSVSLALAALKTETIIERIDLNSDNFIINNSRPDKETAARLRTYLDIWRQRKLIKGHFNINSQNNFPTGSGLASSASGYAALALGLGAMAERKISLAELSRLARLGSGSAARSVIGGIASLRDGTDPAAKVIIRAEDIPWGMVIAIVEDQKKKISSRLGMGHSSRTSPYYENWVTQAKTDYKLILKAIANRNLSRIGEIAEANALAMHACMMSSQPPLVYWQPATVELIRMAPIWRKQGLHTFFTIDAGPNVIFLGKRMDLLQIARRVKRIAGVKQVIVSKPGGGAEVVKWN
jgi:diphosphomevalonate decarboxylase